MGPFALRRSCSTKVAIDSRVIGSNWLSSAKAVPVYGRLALLQSSNGSSIHLVKPMCVSAGASTMAIVRPSEAPEA